MALSTDLNVSPYYDDFDPKKDYYRVLFQPGVAVQARELNQLQSILQNQIEKFGDNVLKRGTVIEGCNVTRHSNVPFVKVKDLTTDDIQVDVTLYNGLAVRNSNGVEASIRSVASGFESQAPDLNTLFVNYTASGSDSNTATFSAGDTLTVYSQAYPIFNIKVNDGASKFANGDTVVITSAVALQYANGDPANSSNFTVGSKIQNGVANGVIIESNTTANSEALILKIRPEYADLISANSVLWRFGTSENVTDSTSGDTARIVSIVGSGAVGSLTTDSLGKVTAVQVVGQGSGYYVPPYISIANNSTTSTFTATELAELELSAENFLTNITVANSSLSPIGSGYGVTVGEGTIYQKGFFSRIAEQFQVVNKYSNTGFDKAVGFDTTESIVNSNEDPTLLDNATGTYNYSAPGADRLKLTPVIQVLDTANAAANTDFLPIIEFADGRPYRTNYNTVYNEINRQLAQRTFEESGNYVIDEFRTLTKDESTFANTASSFKLNIDPGKAYINGNRVVTVDNYKQSINKATTTVSKAAQSIKLGLGSYVEVDEVGGAWDFGIGPRVDLYDTADNFLSGGGGTISAAGTKIGEARVRGLDYLSGDIGSASGKHRMYLFDINMNAGASFADVKSIYYSAGAGAIADVVLNADSKAELKDSRDSSLLYKVAPATANVSNISYTYRTVDSTETSNTTGYIQLNLGAGQYFDYTSDLNTSEKRELLVVPLGDYTSQTNATGSVAVTDGNTTVTGTATQFTSELSTGDWLLIADGSGGNNFSSRIAAIANNTSLTLDRAVTGVGSYSSGKCVLYYPKNVPISLTNKSTRTANVDSSNSQILTISIGNTVSNGAISNSTATNMSVSVTYNARRNNVSSAAKTTHRNSYARIQISNNQSASIDGPWPLGVADVFRMHGVWKANGASQSVTFDPSTNVDATGDFISIASHPYANGDSLLYTGTNSSVGLANNTTYYVVYANSTGFAVSATRGGANVNLVTNSSSTETFTGNAIFFSETTTGVTEVTNQFYIQSGQKEDYLDISYLERKPGYADLSVNDVLLVKFDAFTTASGVKSMGSYSSILDDTANLTSLVADTKINTLEIPEFEGKNGTYYDLRDYIDLRPVAANTINYISDISSTAAGSNAASIINPALPSNTAYFATASGVFPAVNKTLTANIEYYVGRYDRVIIDAKGSFAVRQGGAGTSPKMPTEPVNAITLQSYYIPPYPSLPEGLSSNMVAIKDVKVNGGALGTRAKIYTVSPLIGSIERNRIQNRGYTMKDIGSLESRITALEYYVSFTLAEALAKARFIPSSLDSAVDRFRFGFFVDPFTDYRYSATSHPEFYATIKDNQLVPYLSEINLAFKPDEAGAEGILTLPYNEFTIVNQAIATDGPVVDTTPDTITGGTTTGGTTTGDVTVTTVTQTIQTAVQSEKSRARKDDGSVYEEFFYTFSSLSGPAELYLNARDNNMAITVYQSLTAGGPWTKTTSSAAATRIRQADINNFPVIRTLNGGRKIEGLDSSTLNRKSYPSSLDSGTFIEDQFKLLWTHSPAAGQYVKIRVYKGKNHGADGRSGTFGYFLRYPSDSITTDVITVTNPDSFVYDGTVSSVTPATFRISEGLSYQYFAFGASIPSGSFTADSQKFTISVSGLRQNTYHTFTFDGEDKTSDCVQIRSASNQTNTTGLLTDQNGVLNFEFNYDAGLDEAGTDTELRNRIIATLTGEKRFSVQNVDGTSKAYGIIGMSYYTNLPNINLINTGLNTGGSITSTEAAVTTTTVNTAPNNKLNKILDITNNNQNQDIQTSVSADSSYNMFINDSLNFDLNYILRNLPF